jgi:hypothetical protein
MKLLIPLCPDSDCKKRASFILERVLCNTSIRTSKNGTFEYTGDSDIAWDSQEPKIGDDGLVEVQCINGHTWNTALDWKD